MMTEKGMVSVIIPTYNGSRFISETIQSALDQTYKNLEVIVINDGSTDNTADIVEDFIKKDSRIRLINNKANSGVSTARNIGIENSIGEYIALLDHDDLWLPDKLAKQIPLFTNNTVLVYSNVIAYDIRRNTKYVVHNPKIFRSGKIIEYLSKENFIPCLTALIKKNALFSLKYTFDKDMCMFEEYDLFIRLSLIGDFNFTPEVTAVCRIHGNNEHLIHSYLNVSDISYMLKKYDDLLSKRCKKNLCRHYLVYVAEDLKRAGLKISPAILLILSSSNILKSLFYALFSNYQLERIRALKVYFSKKGINGKQ